MSFEMIIYHTLSLLRNYLSCILYAYKPTYGHVTIILLAIKLSDNGTIIFCKNWS